MSNDEPCFDRMAPITVTAIVSTLTSLPFTQLRKNRYFYLWYDGFYALLCVTLLAAMHFGGYEPFIQRWDSRFWLILPVVCYGQIITSVFIHNATHNNFPRAINRIVGEICGVIVLTRFASWEVIHQRHHKYSDDTESDPHPVVSSYWSFLVKTVIGVERQLQRIYFDLYGDTPEHRRYEKTRAYVSYATNLLLIATWYMFLGPIGFFFFFVPSSIVGFLHLVHFNWSTHNAFSPELDFKPVNLNHGFYKVGNWLWFGIYMHANHHKRANLFNPAKMEQSLPITPPPGKRLTE
jgi:fatty acid desaturase